MHEKFLWHFTYTTYDIRSTRNTKNYSIGEILRQSFGKHDLDNAVIDLINLAGLLREQNSPKAAIQLVKVVAIAADELEKLNKKEGIE